MNIPEKILLLLFALSLIGLLPADAQDDRCPALVEAALTQADDACSVLGRNQACYGNNAIIALDFDDSLLSEFQTAGDITDLKQMSSLTTAPLDLDEREWGIAVLALQANLQGTLPGQNVTFVVFGDTQLTNQVTARESLETPVMVTAHTNSGVNLRAGPGADHPVVGGLAAAAEVTVAGRNAVGDWLFIRADGLQAWIFSTLLVLEDDIAALPIVDEQSAARAFYTAPMQAFQLTTGLGQPACQQAPRDGLLIQAPDDTTVNFLINGVDVQVGSTALLQSQPGALRLNNLDGEVAVTAVGTTRILEAGQRVDVPMSAAPGQAESYAAADVLNAPITLLPEQIDLPLPEGNMVGIFPCTLQGGSVSQPAGTLILRFGWAENTAESVNEAADAISFDFTFDGEPVALWSAIGPVERDDGSFVTNWYWVLPDLRPGQYRAALAVDFSSPFTGSDGTVWDSLEPLVCTVNIEG